MCIEQFLEKEEGKSLIVVAAFLTSLSANLRIDPDLPSPLGTPTTFRHNGYLLQPLPPTPLSFSTLPAPQNPYPSPIETKVMSSTVAAVPAKAATEELPQLNTYTAESEDDRVEGLRLVADSVAQQRQVSSKMLIFHPITLASFSVISAIAIQLMLRWYNDWLMVATTVGGITMTFLIFIRWMTGEYIGLAEDIDMNWLGDDKLLVVKWGEDIIGALVLGWADNDAAKKRGRRRRGKAVIRGWTVKLKYRGKGVGEGLLEEAVKVAGERGADGIIFDAEHASRFSRYSHSRDHELIISQTQPAFSQQSSTATSTSKKRKPPKPSRKSPTTKATSANARARPPGAADRYTVTHFLVSPQRIPFRIVKIPKTSLRLFYERYPHASIQSLSIAPCKVPYLACCFRRDALPCCSVDTLKSDSCSSHDDSTKRTKLVSVDYAVYPVTW
jgi:GNAT superfamily N-acetyltransferase